MNDYISDSMAWSFAGLIVGYSLKSGEIAVRKFIQNRRSQS